MSQKCHLVRKSYTDEWSKRGASTLHRVCGRSWRWYYEKWSCWYR